MSVAHFWDGTDTRPLCLADTVPVSPAEPNAPRCAECEELHEDLSGQLLREYDLVK